MCFESSFFMSLSARLLLLDLFNLLPVMPWLSFSISARKYCSFSRNALENWRVNSPYIVGLISLAYSGLIYSLESTARFASIGQYIVRSIVVVLVTSWDLLFDSIVIEYGPANQLAAASYSITSLLRMSSKKRNDDASPVSTLSSESSYIFSFKSNSQA